MTDDVIVYQFSRSKVERGDFAHFLNLYGPDKLPSAGRLRKMMDSFVFCIGGYDQDPREVQIIPEVRKFYAQFHEAWPYWLYFCNLDVDTLKSMYMCRLPSINTMKVEGEEKVAVTCEPLDLLKMLTQDFLQMNAMCERAEMFESRIFDRTKAVFEYFELPFDEEFQG